METLLRIGLSNAVAAALLALAVGTAACVWRRPAVLHALWLLVLVKLLTPPLVWVCVPWPTVADSPPAAPATQPVAVEPLPGREPLVVPDSEPTVEALADEAVPTSSASGRRKPPDLASCRRPYEESGGLRPPLAEEKATGAIPDWPAAALAVWLAGAAAWYALAVCRLRRFRRLLRHATPAPELLHQRTRRLAEKMGLRRRPTVWLIPGRVAPMLWAAGGRPRILFPSELLGRVGVEQQDALLVHELAHLRRRDHWVRWLEFAAAGLYWWHPVLWFARRELREAEEHCCDAWVTATLPGAGKAYAAALLETLDFLSDAPPAVPLLASGVGRVADLKRRLTMIMRGTTPKALGWRGGLTVLGLGALLLPLLPAWARGQTNKLPEPVVVGTQDGGAAAKKDNASPDEMEKIKAELRATEAELKQKQLETAILAEKVRRLEARAQELQAGPGAGGVTAHIDGGRFILRLVGPEDEKPDALKDLLKQLQSMRPAAVPVIVLDDKSGKIIMRLEGVKVETGDAPPALRWKVVPGGGTAGPTPAADADKRIDELEQKLKDILHELEKLRHERKEGAAGAPMGSGAPAPDQIRNFERLFTGATNAAAVQEQMARAMAEKAAADRAAAEAEKKASEDKIERLREEIRKLKEAAGGNPPAPESK